MMLDALLLRFGRSALEAQPDRQLNVARSSAAQKRIAGAHVGGRGNWQEADSAARRVGAVLQKVDAKIRPQRIGEIRMVEQIEYVYPKLHLDVFAQLVVFHQAEIEILEAGADIGVASYISEVLRSRNAVAARIERARHLEGREVQEIVGRRGAGERIANHVRTAKEFAAAVEVAFKQIVDVEWLTGGQ